MSQPKVKTHYSAAELAAMNLPGLPGAVKNIIAKADREAWEFRKRSGRGGGYEYALTSLPATAQDAIRHQAARQLVATLTPAVPAKPARAPVLREQQLALSLTSQQQTVEGARRGVLTAIERLMAGCGLTKECAMQHLLASVATGEANALTTAMLKRAADERGRKSGTGLPSLRSLKRWFALREAGQLAPQVMQPDFTIPWWARDFLGYWQQPQKPSVELAYRQFCEEMQARTADMDVERILPSVHAVRRFLAKLGTVSRERGRMESRDLKRLQPFVRRDFDDLLPNDVWSADGHCFDAEVQHPITGRPFRPEITSIVDIATRRVVGWSIDLAESGLAVLDALRMAEEQAGMAAIFYVDNGSGYVNAMMKDEGVGLMGRIGLTMLHSIAYNSQARGVIERLHQTLWVNAAKMLPSYMGADMDAQARQRQFKVTRSALVKSGDSKRMPLIGWNDFLQFCRERVAEYNTRPHSSLKGLSPDQAWQGFVARGWQAERLDGDTLEALFRPRLERTVQRGEVRLFNNLYFSDALAELHGETVHVAYDIHNPDQVWVYLTDGRFVCAAGWNANRTSYVPTSAKTAAQEKRAAAQLRNLDKKRDVIEQERGGRPALTLIDSPMVIPGINSREIAGAFERIAEPLEARQPLRVINAEASEAPSTDFKAPATPELRIRLWLELSAQAEAGVLLTERETKWLAAWAFLFSNYAIKDWVVFAEAYGQPLRVGKYDSSATAEDIDTLLMALRQLGTDAAAAIPKNMEISFVDAGNKTASVDIYDRLAAYFDKQISKIVLGQTLSTNTGDGGGGAYALGKVHNEVREDILESDVAELESTLSRDYVRPLVDLNLGPQADYPKIRLRINKPEDLTALAGVVDKLVRAGLPVSQESAYTRFGLTPPKPGEAILVPVDLAPPQQAMNRYRAANSRQPGAAGGDVDPLVTQLAEAAGSPMDRILAVIRQALDDAPDLESFRDWLLTAFGDLPSEQLQDVMATAFSLATLAGRYEVSHGR